MGATKTSVFSPRQNRMAKLAKAFGHPARIAILEILLKRDQCICGDLVDDLPLSQATISQHLKELKDVGLIEGSIEGRKICYCINPLVWSEANSGFVELFKAFQDRRGCCLPKIYPVLRNSNWCPFPLKHEYSFLLQVQALHPISP